MRATRIEAAALVLALTALTATGLAAQQNYPQTLYWGSGLIDIPVAAVPPLSGDMTISYGGKQFRASPAIATVNGSPRMNSQMALSLSGWGRVMVGWAAYSANPEWGFFGRAMLFRQEDAPQAGLLHWLVPSLAVGARNLGPYRHIDRFGMGYQLLPGVSSPNFHHVADSLHQDFTTNNTFYGVATKELSLREMWPTMPNVDLSLTVGYGNGLFKDDGGLGAAYASHATGGLFYGGKVDFQPIANTTLSLMAENNAWDYNIGGVINYRGIEVGVYGTELGAGQAAPSGQSATALYRYPKLAFSVGWQSNIFALMHGNFLQSREARLLRVRKGLLAQINTREQRIAQLQLQINRYEAQNLLELEQRRAAAELELNEERTTLHRLEERLKRVEEQLPPQSKQTPNNNP